MHSIRILLQKCACASPFLLSHALHCPERGYPIIRHVEIRNFFAQMMHKVDHDVEIEPHLQPLVNEKFTISTWTEDEARPEIPAKGNWGRRFERSFYDVKISNPHARTNRIKGIKDSYLFHENLESLKHQDRIVDIEQTSFSSLRFATTGAMSCITH